MTTNKSAARIAAAVAGVALIAMSLGGCATVKGMGRDITSVGQAGENVIKGK